MKDLFREPLVHFLAIGAVLFGAYGWLNRSADPGVSEPTPEIRITEGDVRWLSETWSRQRQRPPTSEEMSGLVTDLVREQLLANEARELGLDENDTIIRRRLAQKVQFLVRDTAQLAEPDDDLLREFYRRHSERYRSAGRVTFTHLLFNPEHRQDAEADARAALATIVESPQTANSFGDRSLMGSDFIEMDSLSIGSVFGPDFADQLMEAETGAWTGPIESAYGVHLVHVSNREPPALLGFDQVRERVQMDWQAGQQRKAEQAYFAALLDKYEVVIEAPAGSSVGPLKVAGRGRI